MIIAGAPVSLSLSFLPAISIPPGDGRIQFCGLNRSDLTLNYGKLGFTRPFLGGKGAPAEKGARRYARVCATRGGHVCVPFRVFTAQVIGLKKQAKDRRRGRPSAPCLRHDFRGNVRR